MRILDNVVNVAPVVKEVTRKDGTKALVAVVTVAGKEVYAWASRPKLIRGTWVIPSYTLKMKLDGAMDSDFQEYTAKDGHKYTAAKVEGEIPQGIQIVGWRSKFDPTVVIMELTVWADYFQK